MIPTEWKKIPLRQIQHSEGAPLLMGCSGCNLFTKCSGLQLELGIYDCLEFCNCSDPSRCDVVCPSAPHRYVQRVREIEGFELAGLRLIPAPAWPISALYIPVIDKPIPGLQAAKLQVAALPFRSAVTRTSGGLRASGADELARAYGGTPTQGWILTGVDHDYRIEQIWGLGKAGRKALFKGLADAGIRCATSPNFSLMADVPRSDNLHSRKRIAIVWSELNEEGLPCALHLNARTPADFSFYAKLLAETGAETVSFEFATGAASKDAAALYLDRMERFTSIVGRPLNLVTRGGVGHYRRLTSMFRNVIQVDTAAHMKAKHRQVLQRGTPGRGFKWVTEESAVPAGELFVQAVEQCRWVDMWARQEHTTSNRQARSRYSPQPSANDEARQLRLLF